MRVSSEAWLEVIRNSPLISIDLVLVDLRQRVLLGWRNNRPAQHCWFVPGGAVFKNETLDAAFRRIAENELGLKLERAQARPLGVFEHFYGDNFSGTPGIGTHYVVLAYRCEIPDGELRPDAQHGELRWFGRGEMLADPQVHAHSRVYAEGL